MSEIINNRVITSNYLRILNVSDGADGSINLSYRGQFSSASEINNPQPGWTYYNTTDNTSYMFDGTAWYKIASDGSDADQGFLDRRYSNDGQTFTLNGDGIADGVITGKYIGLAILSEQITDVAQLDFSKYAWSLLETEVNFTEILKIDTNVDSINKWFLVTDSDELTYSSDYLEIKFLMEKNAIETQLEGEYFYQLQIFTEQGEIIKYPIVTDDENSDQNFKSIKNPNQGDNTTHLLFFAAPQGGDAGTDVNSHLSILDKNIKQIDICLYTRDIISDESSTEGIDTVENTDNEQSFYYTPILIKTIPFLYATTEEMAKLSLLANGIVASVENKKLEFTENGLRIFGTGLTILRSINNQTPVLEADEEGNLVLNNIKAYSGSIGGWEISNQGIFTKYSSPNSGNLYIGMYSGNNKTYNNSPIRFYAGTSEQLDNNSNAGENTIEDLDFNSPFIVNSAGELYASKANITGKIIADSGQIKQYFYIGPSKEDSENTDYANGIVLFGGDGKTENSYISSSQFASGGLGYGWKINSNGQAEFTNINARGKITSSVFEYSRISSIGGSLYIAPTIQLDTSSLPIICIDQNGNEVKEDGDSNTIVACQVKWLYNGDFNQDFGRIWNVQDEIKLEGVIIKGDQKYTISNITGVIQQIGKDTVADSPTYNQNTITITLQKNDIVNDLDPADLNNGYFIEGTLLIFYGAHDSSTGIFKRQGIYLTAAETYGPYIDVYNANDKGMSPSVRLGNLSGVKDPLFSNQSLHGYGLYSNNAYLTGELILPQAGISNQQEIGYAGNNKYESTAVEGVSAIRFWAGAEHPINNSSEVAPFIVTQDGSLYATKGVFEGVVKATSGYFSGAIKSAGIIIKDTLDITSPRKGEDHFFVGYKEEPENYHDYILDINKNGLSIWEGAFQAFSDAANQTFSSEDPVHPVYGYRARNEHGESSDAYENPLPYFYLVDAHTKLSDTAFILDSRVVSYRNHILQMSGVEGQWTSILLDNGIWFANGAGDDYLIERDNKRELEKDIYQFTSQKQNGISSKDNNLTYISSGKHEFSAKNGIEMKSILSIVGGQGNATIQIGRMTIEEINSGTDVIGINII